VKSPNLDLKQGIYYLEREGRGVERDKETFMALKAENKTLFVTFEKIFNLK
jgi:hypothetical protein